MYRTNAILLAAGSVALITLGTAVAAPTRPAREILLAADSAFSRFHFTADGSRYLAIVDYDANVLRRRLWVVERGTGDVLLNAHVSHAFESGVARPRRFSNLRGSNESSTGSFKTERRYAGKYGTGLRIVGLDTGRNDAALDRAIVVHPTPSRWPVWSHGCFTMTKSATARFIDLMEGGALLYVHASTPSQPAAAAQTVRVQLPLTQASR